MTYKERLCSLKLTTLLERQRERRNKREETSNTNQHIRSNTATNGNISDASVNSTGSF